MPEPTRPTLAFDAASLGRLIGEMVEETLAARRPELKADERRALAEAVAARFRQRLGAHATSPTSPRTAVSGAPAAKSATRRPRSCGLEDLRARLVAALDESSGLDPNALADRLADVAESQRADRARRRRRVLLGFAAAFLVFLALRTIGIAFGSVPIMVHPDERHYAGVAQLMSFDDLNPHYFENPPALTYVLFAAKELYGFWMGSDAMGHWVNDGNLYMLARMISALLGTLTAFVVGGAALKLLRSRTAGILAAAVVGLSFLHGRDSHYGVNDVPMTFLVSVVLYLSARALADGGTRRLYLAAAVAGLAAATKYNGAVAVALPAMVVLQRELPLWKRGGLTRIVLQGACITACFAAAFILANPWVLLSFEEFKKGFDNQFTNWGDNKIWGQSGQALPLLYAEACHGMLGLLNLAAAIAGIGVVFLRWRKAALVILATPVLYLIGMYSKPLFFWRFALPLLPFLAVLAAAAWSLVIESIAARPKGGNARRTAAFALGAVIVVAGVEPTAKLVRHDLLLRQPHTWLLARDWILRNIPAGSRLFLAGYPPDFPPVYTEYLPRLALDGLHTIVERDEHGQLRQAVDMGGYLVIDGLTERGWQNEKDAQYWADFFALLRKTFVCIARFPPGPDGNPKPYVLDAMYSPLQDLWGIDRPGHVIEVYKIEPGMWLRVMPRNTDRK